MWRQMVVVALVFGVGCGEKGESGSKTVNKDEPIKPSAETTPASNAPAKTGEKKKKRAAPIKKPVTKREARERLESWLRAQNEGDFALYESQYAKNLVGIKRVADRKTRFDRAGWLKDRKRMFRKKMVVEADDVKLNVDAHPATVVFVQTWSSGTFKDKGPKRLTLAREGNQVLVSREEMLASKVDSSHNTSAKAVAAIDATLRKLNGEELEIYEPGMGGVARRYKVDGALVKVWQNLSADHHDVSTTIYYKDGKPFYVSFDGTYGEDVEYDENGGTAGSSRYVYREFLLSDSAVTAAWERDKTFEGEYPDGAEDELMAIAPSRLDSAVGNDKLFEDLVELADFYKTAKDGRGYQDVGVDLLDIGD